MAIRHRELCVIPVLQTLTFKEIQAVGGSLPFPSVVWKVADSWVTRPAAGAVRSFLSRIFLGSAVTHGSTIKSMPNRPL